MLRYAGLLLLGIATGYFGGLVGIVGGIIVIPALVLLFGFSQANAQGTTMAMLLPPLGLFAVIIYQQKGLVDWKVAAILCIGFVIGSPFGAKLAVGMSPVMLRKIFGVALALISARMLFGK
jgi:hypothetical protein